jgi:hypothetical protein
MALGAAFALAAFIIVGATIRMAVLARAREIQLMRLVGATTRSSGCRSCWRARPPGCSAGWSRSG